MKTVLLAFVLYQSTEEYEGEKNIGYLQGDLISTNPSLMNYTNKELDDNINGDVIWLTLGRGDLYFDQDRDVVWIGQRDQKAAQRLRSLCFP